jgi:hypothetical protein
MWDAVPVAVAAGAAGAASAGFAFAAVWQVERLRIAPAHLAVHAPELRRTRRIHVEGARPGASINATMISNAHLSIQISRNEPFACILTEVRVAGSSHWGRVLSTVVGFLVAAGSGARSRL